MKRLLTLCFATFFILSSLSGQIRLKGYQEDLIHPDLYNGRWNARWISIPGEAKNEYGIYHFRKTVELDSLPQRCIVHVSADNRYKLYVNGELVSLGPARGDLYNWNFETIDLAPYLRKGKNVLASVVWNYAEYKPVAQISFDQTGFILQGNTERDAVFNTDTSWVCMKNKAYSPWQGGAVLGYYVAGPGEYVDCSGYPWGWEQPGYNDTVWGKVLIGNQGAMKGAMDYPGRLLVPSPIPPMEYRKERFASLRLIEGIERPSRFPGQPEKMMIPANSEVYLQLDNNRLTTGYLSLLFSKGREAEIKIGYAEALYRKIEKSESGHDTFVKENRNETDGKDFIGYEDVVIADGGDNRAFTTLWWRTWRYVQLTIVTADEPLVLEDVYGTFSAYPFKQESRFMAEGRDDLNRMLDIGWRTARLCANETYMDCPYYEQLQYLGDTRIQAMITLYNTRDSFMVKNALEQGRQSMVADGLTMSRYPSALHQFIPSFSLWWIQMGHDYWMYRGEEAYLKTLLPAFRSVLAWYEQWLKPDHSLDYIPHWFFQDWAAGLPVGSALREKEGNSAFQDLLYLMTLDAASQMEDEFGLSSMAAHYKEIAKQIRSRVKGKYWNTSKRLFADTSQQEVFSQHINALAILAGIVEEEEAKDIMARILEDKSLIQTTIYFRYYLNQALCKAGLADEYLNHLQIWQDQMDLGLSTWAETPEPARSDCHAWGASPNIEIFRTVLGVSSDAPGFKKIKFVPALGKLREVAGSIPHPQGSIYVSYHINQKDGLIARFNLPSGSTGEFVWNGKKYLLKEGVQKINIEKDAN